MKISKIASAHNGNIISENFVRHTEEVAGQSVRQLKIFLSRLANDPVERVVLIIEILLSLYTFTFPFCYHSRPKTLVRQT